MEVNVIALLLGLAIGPFCYFLAVYILDKGGVDTSSRKGVLQLIGLVLLFALLLGFPISFTAHLIGG